MLKNYCGSIQLRKKIILSSSCTSEMLISTAISALVASGFVLSPPPHSRLTGGVQMNSVNSRESAYAGTKVRVGVRTRVRVCRCRPRAAGGRAWRAARAMRRTGRSAGVPRLGRAVCAPAAAGHGFVNVRRPRPPAASARPAGAGVPRRVGVERRGGRVPRAHVAT